MLALAIPLAFMTTAGSSPPLTTPAAVDALSGIDFADPFVLRDGDAYYAFGTGANGRHVQVARSADLTGWVALPDALPALPAWAARADGFTWAPSVLRRGSSYVLYYTARDASADMQCISRAVSTRPEGGYVDTSTRPFVCQVSGESSFCGSIDPSPFVDEAGDAFLFWKSDENSSRCRGASRLWGQRLTPDGLDVTGPAVPLLTMDQPWERPLIEGPSMVANERAFHLFYSANWYESPSYAVGYATCSTPLGPCKKVTVNGPLFQSLGATLGPGGQEFFDDASGAKWMAFHAWSAPHTSYPAGGARTLRFARLTFAAGVPVVTERVGAALGAAVASPAGSPAGTVVGAAVSGAAFGLPDLQRRAISGKTATAK